LKAASNTPTTINTIFLFAMSIPKPVETCYSG
jgi:hypothetical protein